MLGHAAPTEGIDLERGTERFNHQDEGGVEGPMHARQTSFGSVDIKSGPGTRTSARGMGMSQARILSARLTCPIALAVVLLAYPAMVGAILPPSGSLSSPGGSATGIR